MICLHPTILRVYKPLSFPILYKQPALKAYQMRKHLARPGRSPAECAGQSASGHCMCRLVRALRARDSLFYAARWRDCFSRCPYISLALAGGTGTMQKAALLLLTTALLVAAEQTPFSRPLDSSATMKNQNWKQQAQDFAWKEGDGVFSPKDLVGLGRPGAGVTNDAGDLVLVPYSKYDLEERK